MLLALPATVLGSLADMCVQYEAGQVRFATIDSSSELPHRWSSVVTLKRAAHITTRQRTSHNRSPKCLQNARRAEQGSAGTPRNRLAKSILFFTSITAPAAIPTVPYRG